MTIRYVRNTAEDIETLLHEADPTNPEDELIAIIDAERAGTADDEAEAFYDDSIEIVEIHELREAPVAADVDDEGLPRRLTPQRPLHWVEIRRDQRDRSQHDCVLCSSHRTRIANHLDTPTPEDPAETLRKIEEAFRRIWEEALADE
jgi:hypothetical protein